jgi:muconolactone D-isomerase
MAGLAEREGRTMEFLVHIQVSWPDEIDPDEQKRLIAAEGVRARELGGEGRIKRLWRIPGRWANYGLWDAPDATTLHTAITSLPLYRFLDVTVTPLAQHPNDPEVWR